MFILPVRSGAFTYPTRAEGVTNEVLVGKFVVRCASRFCRARVIGAARQKRDQALGGCWEQDEVCRAFHRRVGEFHKPPHFKMWVRSVRYSYRNFRGTTRYAPCRKRYNAPGHGESRGKGTTRGVAHAAGCDPILAIDCFGNRWCGCRPERELS